MGYRDPTYVVFDGDEDKWAYAYMKGWKNNDKIDFDFYDAHDLDNMTSRAQSEDYVKGMLRERMKKSVCIAVLIGEKTKNLFRFVRWELELAQDMGLPIVAVNLNQSRVQDDRCPPILRDTCVMQVAFRMKIIQHALNNWPNQYHGLSAVDRTKGWYYYSDNIYAGLGL